MFKPGDRIFIVRAEQGAWGVNGKVGIVTKEASTRGKYQQYSELSARVNGEVWGLGMLKNIEAYKLPKYYITTNLGKLE